jgi:O-antigen/teichoic acid export membrane protein
MDHIPRDRDDLPQAVDAALPPPVTPGSSGARGATWVAVAMAGANALGYLLNLVASRVLGPSAFGALGALLGLVLIGNVVALGLQTVTARVLASSPEDGGRSAGDLYRLGRWSAAAVTGLAFAAAPVVAHLLHLRDGWSAWVLPVVLGALTITGVQLGLLQGGERFRRLAVLYLLAAAGKVGGGLIGLAVGGSVTSTMAGTAAGALVSAATGHLLVRDQLVSPGRIPVTGHLSELLWATHALLVLFMLTNVDVLLARHYLPGPEAGLYAVGAVVAKGAFWLPSFVAVVALPALADHQRRRRAAGRAIAAVTASGVAFTAFCAAFGGLVVTVVGGSAYAALAPHVWLFAAAGSLYALAQLLLYSRLATTDRRALAVVWAGLGLLLVLVIGWWHQSATEIVVCVLVAASAVVAAGLLAELHEHGRSPRA